MTAEAVFKFYRAYKFFYRPGGYNDLARYAAITCPPLIQQRERQFYYRISQQLNDSTIHALYTYGFFFNPGAHVSALATPDAFSAALSFAGRAENGTTLLQHDLYELKKRLSSGLVSAGIDTWLYGELDSTGNRPMMPPCVQDIISKDLPLDIAALVLLIPQKDLDLHWGMEMWRENDMGLGAQLWIDRLKKLDLLLRANRPGWRMQSHELARDFWHAFDLLSLAPLRGARPEASLF
jgi:hypothetical protein